jgi:hypothetical protein
MIIETRDLDADKKKSWAKTPRLLRLTNKRHKDGYWSNGWWSIGLGVSNTPQ